MTFTNRAGRYIQQTSNYKAFIPNSLPPQPAIEMDSEMLTLLSKADRCLGRLDGIIQILPNPDLFVAMYVKKEALLSSQIEGTQASFIDVLDISDSSEMKKEKNVEEVVNYVKAMNYGLERLNELPLSLRLIREIHRILLTDVRGSERSPGEFRRSQNWLGPSWQHIVLRYFCPSP